MLRSRAGAGDRADATRDKRRSSCRREGVRIEERELTAALSRPGGSPWGQSRCRRATSHPREARSIEWDRPGYPPASADLAAAVASPLALRGRSSAPRSMMEPAHVVESTVDTPAQLVGERHRRG